MYKVLIVENNPTIIKLLSHFFQAEGCDIRLAEDCLRVISVRAGVLHARHPLLDDENYIFELEADLYIAKGPSLLLGC